MTGHRHPADDLPLLGPMVGYLERITVNMGMPPCLREVAALVLLGVFAYLLLRLVVRPATVRAGLSAANPAARPYRVTPFTV